MICNDTLHTLVFLLVGVQDRSSTAKMCSIPLGVGGGGGEICLPK